MTPLRRILSDEGHAGTFFVGVICGLALVLVIVVVTHTFGRAAL